MQKAIVSGSLACCQFMNFNFDNGVYQSYLEHVRHEYLKDIGIDFAEYARNGINLVVVRAELDALLSEG